MTNGLKRTASDADLAPIDSRDPKKIVRNQRDREADAPLLGGDMQQSIERHAFERGRHFFLFMLTLDMLAFETERATGKPVDPADLLSIVATDQADSGIRRSAGGPYHNWNKRDPGLIARNAQQFANQDAAHFCNLGIKPERQNALLHQAAALTADGKSNYIKPLVMDLRRICGNTAMMPQNYNVGVDKAVDHEHGRLAQKYIKNAVIGGGGRSITTADGTATVARQPLFTRQNVEDYTAELSARVAKGATGSDAGVAACYSAYGDALNVAPRQPDRRTAFDPATGYRAGQEPRRSYADEVHAVVLGNAGAARATYGQAVGEAFTMPSGKALPLFAR